MRVASVAKATVSSAALRSPADLMRSVSMDHASAHDAVAWCVAMDKSVSKASVSLILVKAIPVEKKKRACLGPVSLTLVAISNARTSSDA